MALGKRKADQIEDESVSKKSGKALPRVKVAFHEGGTVKPVIATTPGLSLPSNLKFESFTKPNPNGNSEVLLRSSTHPTVDFTATENDSHNDKHLKHYVAVFDPATGDLQVTEARRLTTRSNIRRQEPAESDAEASGEETKGTTNYSSRAALTNTFGTKKSRKAVQSRAENRMLTQGGDDANNPLSKAILSLMPESDIPEDTDTKELAQSNKPLPVPNLKTDDVRAAYPLTSLIFPSPPSTTLAQMPISAWVDSISKDKPVNAPSRFVANRVAYLIRAYSKSPEDVILKLNVQLIRYVLILIEISAHLKTLRSHAQIPPPSRWPPGTITGNIPYILLTGITDHFFPSKQINSPGTMLLHTTILAIALHIPPPSFQVAPGTLITEPTDLQQDLSLDPKVCNDYYRELGCKSASASDAELALWGLEKLGKKRKTADGEKAIPKPRFAKLKLPLVFPQTSMGRNRGRR